MYKVSDGEEKLLLSRNTVATLVVIFVGVYSLGEEFPRGVMLFLPVYFLTFFLSWRLLAHNARSGIGRTILKRLLFSLTVSVSLFATLVLTGAVKIQEVIHTANMEVTCVLLLIIGVMGIYDDWRTTKLSVGQPLYLGAIGWAVYLLLWIISKENP